MARLRPIPTPTASASDASAAKQQTTSTTSTTSRRPGRPGSGRPAKVQNGKRRMTTYSTPRTKNKNKNKNKTDPDDHPDDDPDHEWKVDHLSRARELHPPCGACEDPRNWEYLVHWSAVGDVEYEPTWEPAANMSVALVHEFWVRKHLEARARARARVSASASASASTGAGAGAEADDIIDGIEQDNMDTDTDGAENDVGSTSDGVAEDERRDDGDSKHDAASPHPPNNAQKHQDDGDGDHAGRASKPEMRYTGIYDTHDV
ncbi:hypothetical protein F5B21DRAFT_36901 [Xylaria acuta]|nr:hypothetical protein F5B21DRAFT_36901 [Xylaria acuta]